MGVYENLLSGKDNVRRIKDVKCSLKELGNILPVE